MKTNFKVIGLTRCEIKLAFTDPVANAVTTWPSKKSLHLIYYLTANLIAKAALLVCAVETNLSCFYFSDVRNNMLFRTKNSL